MRDLKNPLAISLFDGEKPPNGGNPPKKSSKRKPSRNYRRAVREHEKLMKRKGSKDKDKSQSQPQPKSKFGEARGISTKAEDKKKVYCKPGKQLDKSCAGADPRGFKESGRN